LFIMYARYCCIHVSSVIITSSGSGVLPSVFSPSPEPVVVVELLIFFIDLSNISSQKTPDGMGRHCDPIFARLLAYSLLFLLTWKTSHPSKVPSR
jgi:hypothetical protein